MPGEGRLPVAGICRMRRCWRTSVLIRRKSRSLWLAADLAGTDQARHSRRQAAGAAADAETRHSSSRQAAFTKLITSPKTSLDSRTRAAQFCQRRLGVIWEWAGHYSERNLARRVGVDGNHACADEFGVATGHAGGVGSACASPRSCTCDRNPRSLGNRGAYATPSTTGRALASSGIRPVRRPMPSCAPAVIPMAGPCVACLIAGSRYSWPCSAIKLSTILSAKPLEAGSSLAPWRGGRVPIAHSLTKGRESSPRTPLSHLPRFDCSVFH